MDTVVANDYYWNMLKGLSDDRKVDLIDRLAKSLIRKEKTNHDPVASLYGIWKDEEDSLSAEELVKEIRDARTFKDDIEAF